jgi:hypothetical protein
MASAPNNPQLAAAQAQLAAAQAAAGGQAPPGYGPPPHAYGAPPGQPGGYGPPPQGPQGYGAPPGAPPAYGQPPQGQYGQPQGGFGQPPAYGAPPGQPGAYGAPPGQPAGYGPPPGQPGGYGAPPGQPGAYGAPPGGGYGQQPGYGAPQGQQPFAPYAPPGAAGAPITVAPGTPKPTVRNPLMTLLLPMGAIFGGFILQIVFVVIASAMESGAIAAIGGLIAGLVILGGAVLTFLAAVKMMNELRAITKAENLAWWGLLIPLYSLYIMLIVVPQEMTKAKQALRVQEPARNIVFYWLLFLYAFAADLNDIARVMP